MGEVKAKSRVRHYKIHYLLKKGSFWLAFALFLKCVTLLHKVT